MRTALLLTLPVLLPLTHIHAVTADTSCGIIWDSPILLSDTALNSATPQIALSGDDTIHITWEGAVERLPYVRSTDAGSSFTRTDILTDSINAPVSFWNLLCAYGQKVYVFFLPPGVEGVPMWMKASTNGGSTWLTVMMATDTAGEIRSASITGDTIAIVYSRRGIKRILRTTNAGTTWTSTNQEFDYFARVALSPGVLHLVQMGSDETEYRRSHDLGNTWVQQILLSTPDGLQSSDPAIAAGTTAGDTTVIAAWRDPKYGCIGVFGCSIIGKTADVGDSLTDWGEETVHTGKPRGFEPSVATHGGRYAVAWRDEVDPGTTFHAFVRVSRIGDTSWCSPYDLTPTTLHKVINVEVALSTKAIHVVWEQNIAPDPSTFRIFYRRGRFTETDVKEGPGTRPLFARLQQNYPNPFNPATTIPYALSERGFVSLKVYDFLGREIGTLVNKEQDAGSYEAIWEPTNQASGMYFYRLLMAGRTTYNQTRSMILLR